MKVLAACGLALGTALLAPASVMAQTTPAKALTVLPPPSINAPGAKPVAPASTPSPVGHPSTPATASTAIPIPALPGMHEPAPHDARGGVPPQVKVSKHDGKVIEQYYEGGQLYMVQVHPKHGVTYTYYVHKGHKLSRSAGAPPVNPALYTILTWGGGSDDSD